MDADENPYQAQFDQWDRFYRNVVLPQLGALNDEDDARSEEVAWSQYFAQLRDLDVDIPMTDREEYSEVDFGPSSDGEASSLLSSRSSRSVRTASETSSTFTAPYEALSELHVSNQAHNKYVLSPETSAYANELAGIFSDKEFGNVDDPEHLRLTSLRDFCKSSIEDLRVLPDPFANKMRYCFD